MSTPISLLKAASAANAGHQLGEGLKVLGKAAKNSVDHSADFGGAVAKSLGGPEAAGRVLGVAGLAVGAGTAAKKTKENIDDRVARRRMMRGYR